MGRVARAALAAAFAALGVATQLGCSHTPKDKGGSWYVVRPGDTLWKLSQRYATSVEAIERANSDVDAAGLRVGQKLWIPGGGTGSSPGSGRERAHTLEQRDAGDCGDLARREKVAFEWPVFGHLTSSFGDPRSGHEHEGVDLAASEGTPVHAAEAGRVIYAGDQLGDYGRVIIVKHVGRWATVYAHNRKNLVADGDFVEKGDVIAEVGDTGNASAPHLHFEVRRGNVPRDPQSCLP